MALMMGHLYRALIFAGASENLAREAAEEAAAWHQSRGYPNSRNYLARLPDYSMWLLWLLCGLCVVGDVAIVVVLSALLIRSVG